MSRTYLASLNAALHDLMARDERVVFIGEDVRDPYGGAFKVSKGIHAMYPGRVFSSPVSEAGIVGIGAGFAMRGFRSIVEIMFGDFSILAADQLINTASKFPLMYGENVRVPLVVRTPMGGGRGYGPTHSQSLEKMFLGVPGLDVVSPSLFHDPGSLLMEAVTGTSRPVLFVESKLLYPSPLLSGAELRTRMLPGGRYPVAVAENFSGGKPDVVVLAYGGASLPVSKAMLALRQEEIKVRAFLPSALSDPPGADLLAELDGEAPIVIAEEGTESFNWGSEIAACIYERLLGRLRRPVIRVSSRNGVVPARQDLEVAFLLSEEKVMNAIVGALT